MLARQANRYASAIVSMVLTSALFACSGDDNNGSGTGGSVGTGGSAGSAGAGGKVDAGKDSGTGGSSTDARPDGTGGSGGSVGTGGSGGVDSSMGGGGTGGGGTGGSVSDSSAERDAVASADARDGTLDQTTPGSDTGSDAPASMDAPIGSEPQNDVVVTNDVSDAGPVPPADASDGNTGPGPSDAASDHAACGVPAGGTTYFSFDTDVQGWSFSDGENPTPHPQNGTPPAGSVGVVQTAADGCPATGELRLTIPFEILAGDEVPIQGAVFRANLPGDDWTGRTALHVKIKVETQGGLEWLNPFIQFNTANPDLTFWEAPNGSADFVAANLRVNVWNDLVIPLPNSDAGSIGAASMGIQVFAVQTGVVQIAIDSITLE